MVKTTERHGDHHKRGNLFFRLLYSGRFPWHVAEGDLCPPRYAALQVHHITSLLSVSEATHTIVHIDEVQVVTKVLIQLLCFASPRLSGTHSLRGVGFSKLLFAFPVVCQELNSLSVGRGTAGTAA